MSLDEASAKIRTGPPTDDEEDLGLPVWAGVIPLTLEASPPIPDDGVTDSPPGYAVDYTRRA